MNFSLSNNSFRPVRWLLSSLWLVLLPLLGWGQIATYTPSTSNANPVTGTGNANLTIADLTIAGATYSSSAGNYRGTGWDGTVANGASAATIKALNNTVSAGKYITFTLTANAGYALTISSISFGVGRSGTGPRQFQWRSNADGYAAALPVSTANASLDNASGVLTTTPDASADYTGNVISLSGTDFTSIPAGTSRTFRFYAYSSEASGGTGGLAGPITVAGSVTASTSPNLTSSPASLTGFTYAFGAGPSAEQSFTISGTNLSSASGNITASVPTTSNYELSTTSGSGFTNSVSVAYTSANPTTIGPVYVRLKSGLPVGTYTENVSLSGGGGTATVALSGNIVPALTEVYVPQYALASGTTTGFVPYAFRATLSGLTASATYRYLTQAVKTTDAVLAANLSGGSIFALQSGNFVRTAAPSLSTTNNYDSFTASATGTYTGWFVLETNTTATFAAGGLIYPVIVLNDGTAGNTTIASLVPTTSAVTLLRYGAAGTGTATGAYGLSGATAKNFVLTYDNTAGTGRPLYASFVESDGSANTAANGYATFYGINVQATAGRYGLLTPSTNANGIQRIEQRALTDGSLVCANTDADGVWPSGVNTVNPTPTASGTATTNVLVIAAADAPLAAPGTISVNPTTGGAGTSLTITGTNFIQGGTTVTVGGAAASITALTSTSITTTVPTGAAIGAGQITLNTTSTCNAQQTTAFTVTAPVPAISVTGALTAFNTLAGAPSAAQTISVAGGNLTADLVVTAPTGYEVSLTSGSGYAPSLNLTPSSGTVASTPVYVRLTGGTPTASLGTSLLVRSTGAANQDQTVSGTVVAEPTTAPTVVAGTPGNTTITLTLSGGNGSNYLVVVRPSASPAVAPTDATTYTGTAAYGTGATTGANNYIVLAATTATTTINVTGLAISTAYAADVYAYNVGTVAGFENYLATAGTTTFTTATPPPALVIYSTANFTTSSTSVFATTTATNATSTDIVRGTVSAANMAGIFGSSSFSTGTTLASAISGNDYVGFTVAANTGYLANVSSVALEARITSAGPTKLELLYSADNTFATYTSLGVVTATTTSTLFTFTPPASTLQGVTGTLFFRLYGYGGGTGNLYVLDAGGNNGLTVFGTVTAAVPGNIIVSTTGPLNVGTTVQNNAGVTTQSYTVEGNTLGSTPITVTAPAGFQVSTDVAFTGITTDANSFTLAPTAGSVPTTTVYVRLSGFGTPGPQSGNVTNTSGISTPRNVAVTGTVTTAPAEINIAQGATDIASNNTPAFAFADRMVGARSTIAFTIQNTGGTALALGTFTTTAGTDFTVVGPLPTTVPAFSSATFSVRFEPSAVGTSTGTISIVNNDSDENPYVLNFTGQGLTPTFKTWTGMAGDNSYFNPANWAGNTLPATTDEVLLDHSVVTGAYTVQVAGVTGFPASAVSILSLTINPNGGPAIELVVPPTNSIVDALTVTQTAAGATALAIYNGGIVTTGSGGVASGSGIDISGNGPTLFIYNGGRYQHFTQRSSSSVTENLSGVGGTEDGTFVFNVVPTTAGSTLGIALQGRTFGNLTFQGTDAAGYSATGSSPILINGNLTVEAGTTFADNLTTTTIKGNIINNSTLRFTGTTLTLSGITPQTISGNALGLATDANRISSSTTVVLDNLAGLTLATPVRVNGTLQLTNGSITTSSTSVLTLVSNALGASATRFVNGPLARVTGTGAATTVFPIGKGLRYRPLTLTSTAQTAAATYTAEQLEGNTSRNLDPGNGLGTAPLTRVAQTRFFTVTTSNAASGFAGTITLSFGSDDYVNTPSSSELVIAKRDGGTAGAWTNLSRTTSTGSDSGPGGAPVAGTLTSASFSGFSDFTLGATNDISSSNAFTVINPLPVQLTRFSAARAAKGVQLAWATASELNSDYFEVERSLDGKAFVAVARVAAHGSTTQAHEYAALDGTAPATLLYYRLRQVDLDGTVAYSPVVTVAGTDGATATFTLAPNPARESISFVTDAPTTYTLRNTLGQVVRTGTTLAGTNTVAVAELPTGVYFFELHGQAGRVVRKFVKE